MDWHSMPVPQVLEELGVGVEDGLSEDDARLRLERYGPNRLSEAKRRSVLARLGAQFHSALIYILLLATAVSAVAGEIADAAVILAIVLLNAVIGVIQEGKAERALEALKEMASPRAVVRRGGTTREVDSSELVPGDCVILETGRVVPADVRLVETANLRIEESALTGESVSVEKDANSVIDPGETALGDMRSMAFAATTVSYGRGRGVVVATGMKTQVGRIATLLESQEDEVTPLQRRLADFGRTLGLVILGLCAVMFGVGILQEVLRSGTIPRDTTIELFLTAVSLAVAAIPEGLPAIVTVVLAIGVQQMSRENAIVRRLAAVETLGSVTVVCTDKTGTLTQNRMTVTDCFIDGRSASFESLVAGTAGERMPDPVVDSLFTVLVHCNDATLVRGVATGDPTETALLVAGERLGLSQAEISRSRPRVAEKPFDSVRKMMSTVAPEDGPLLCVYTKGAVDSMLPRCTGIMTASGVRPITDSDRAAANRAAEAMSDEALRVLAAATRTVSAAPIGAAGSRASGTGPDMETLEDDLVFVGLVGMIDPPRTEVRDAIVCCVNAGITPVMITGDHQNTAFAIARDLGIASEKTQTLTGSAIDGVSDDELATMSETVRVFARVSPEHKVRIVRAFRSRGHLVSMTGDGVNDAPSLKAADIGVAMGITGTDVAKGASDMVLTDDNFTTIIRAIAAGRNIYANIKKAITFLLSCNAGEIITIFAAILIGWKSPLLPIHILWINLITDSLPALGLGMDRSDPHVLERPPRPPGEKLFADGTGLSVALNGSLIGAVTLAAYRLGFHLSGDSLEYARTMAFVVLALSQLFHAFDVRDRRQSIFSLGLFTNRWLWLALGVGAAIQWIIVSVPGLDTVFRVVPLSGTHWALAFALAVTPVIVNELAKLIRRGWK